MKILTIVIIEDKQTLNSNYRFSYKFVITDYTSFNNQILNFIPLKMIILVISSFICRSVFPNINLTSLQVFLTF
jgi:hypothetical protein